jgi:hypothetical protein
MDKKSERLCAFIEVEREVPRLLDHPGSVGVGRATGEMDAPRGELDEHQNVDSLQPHGFDGEEVASHNARSLLRQELPPRRAATPGCWPEAVAGKHFLMAVADTCTRSVESGRHECSSSP